MWPSWKTSVSRFFAPLLNISIFARRRNTFFSHSPPSPFKSKRSKTISAFASLIAAPIASLLLRKDLFCLIL